MVDKINFKRSVGDNTLVKFWFVDDSNEPKRITDHIITMLVEGFPAITGTMDEGDCRVYFDIPVEIYSVAGNYSFTISEIKDNSGGRSEVVAKGTISYS